MICPSCKHESSSLDMFPRLEFKFKPNEEDFPTEVSVYKYEDFISHYGNLFCCPKCGTVIFQ